MKNLFIIFLAIFSSAILCAQDSQDTKQPAPNVNKSLLGYFILEDSKPVVGMYEGGLLIENQTSKLPSAKSLEMVIQHRFGDMDDGFSDLFGIWAGANTRLGLNYAITDWAQVGFGTTSNYRLQDFSLKINFLKQSRDKKSPLDVTYYGNFSIDAREKDVFGDNYKFGNRVAYFNELLISRKFFDWFSMSVGGSFTHFNQVDSLMEHDKVALHVLGRFKFSPQSSIIVNFDLPFEIDAMKEWNEFTNPPKYNFGIGYEVATATHTFQVFAGSSTFLVPQYNVMYNQYEFFKGADNIFIGFNITRQWNF